DRRLGAPAVRVAKERLRAAEVRGREDQEPAGAQDPEDLLEGVEGVDVEVLEELAEEDGVEGAGRSREGLALDLTRQDLDPGAAAGREEGRPWLRALDGVVEPGHPPAAGLREGREVTGEGADVEQAAALASGQEAEGVLVAPAVILEIPGLPGGERPAGEVLDLAGEGAEVESGGRLGRRGPEGHAGRPRVTGRRGPPSSRWCRPRRPRRGRTARRP